MKTRSIDIHALIEEEEVSLLIDEAHGTKPIRFVCHIIARTNIGNRRINERNHIFHLKRDRIDTAKFIDPHHRTILTLNLCGQRFGNQQRVLLNGTQDLTYTTNKCFECSIFRCSRCITQYFYFHLITRDLTENVVVEKGGRPVILALSFGYSRGLTHHG